MADTISYKTRSRSLAILLTLLVTGTVFLILLFVILYTPIPPFPEGGGGKGDGIELNLGFSDVGMGNNPQESSAAENEISKPEVQAKPENEKLMTQDVEDAPSINEADRKRIKKEVKKDFTIPKKETKKEPEKPKQVVNQKALYPAKRNQTSADGNSKVAGDQGNPNGSLAAKAFGGKNGQGGSGGGTGGGTGSGTGNGVGSGISYSLIGRSRVGDFPIPEYKQQVEGVVVVEVTVDKEGNVTQAVPGIKGTTVNDNSLWEAAREAAKKAKFNRKPDAPAFQKGKIIYSFRLQ